MGARKGCEHKSIQQKECGMARLTIPRYTRIMQTIPLLILFFLGIFGSPAFANSSIQLTWEANQDPDLMGYRVYMGTSTGSYPTINEAGLTQSFLFQNLAEGKSYYFTVTAYDQAGNYSGPSEEVSVEIPDSTPPTLPDNVTLISVSNSELSFNWTPSTDNVSVTSYEIARDGIVMGLSQTHVYIDSTIMRGTLIPIS